ncbi:NAD(P)H-dependent glycerol-3-phosphate dehydrogenase [Sphingomonas sp.]|uniref:NAD(P)H-dependent glycerol-3-phosphate dehydrogenase n=1 Tax=Sphingomonas sp. TaxID=28214 RepID=UPI0038AA4F88
MKLGVIGGGAWGTALAQVASAGEHETLLWAIEPDVVESINERHENPLFLAGVPLNPAIRATSDLADLAGCDAWLVVTPAQHMRAVLGQVADCDKPLILCSKGIEEKSGELLHKVARQTCPRAGIAVLSGPTFAHEVAKGFPTAVTLAAEDEALAERLRDRIKQPTFRIYISDDVAGAEIGGAVKNVLAVACGVVEGKGLGQNARAALIGRGFAEMTRFGLAFGARRETLAGLSGLGDLVLTCSSVSSRNYSLGKGIGEGRAAAELLADRKTVAEGAFTAPVLARLAREKGIDMPIVDAVDALIAGRANVDEVLDALLTRPSRAEGV